MTPEQEAKAKYEARCTAAYMRLVGLPENTGKTRDELRRMAADEVMRAA